MLIAQNLSKHYPSAQGWIKSLDEMDLEVKAGEFLAIRGHSGRQNHLASHWVPCCAPAPGGSFLRARISMQLATTSCLAREQLVLFSDVSSHFPACRIILHSWPGKSYQRRADTLLDTLNLKHRETICPISSVGERATGLRPTMMASPKLILADEPTGNLDPRHATEVCEHLRKFRDSGGTVILVTHGELASSFADRTIFLEQGRLLETVEGHAQTAP